MSLGKNEQYDTVKFQRTPRNLLDYVISLPDGDDFKSLLAKHYKNLKMLFQERIEHPEVKDAIFVVELNNFEKDLISFAKLCAEIELENSKRRDIIESSREKFKNIDPEELKIRFIAFYQSACEYNEHFQFQVFMPKINNINIFPLLLKHPNPFKFNSEISNEEKIRNLISTFNANAEFFKDYLNVLYVDEKPGEEFLGKTYEEVYLEYKKICNAIDEMSLIIPDGFLENIDKSIKSKEDSLRKIMDKYPATLYIATKNILGYLENVVDVPPVLSST